MTQHYLHCINHRAQHRAQAHHKQQSTQILWVCSFYKKILHFRHLVLEASGEIFSKFVKGNEDKPTTQDPFIMYLAFRPTDQDEEKVIKNQISSYD